MVFCEYFEVQIRIGWSLRVSDALRCNRGRWEVPNTNAVFHTKGGGGGGGGGIDSCSDWSLWVTSSWVDLGKFC